MANAHSSGLDELLGHFLEQLRENNPDIVTTAGAFSIDIRRLIVERASEPDGLRFDVIAAALAIVLRGYVKTLVLAEDVP